MSNYLVGPNSIEPISDNCSIVETLPAGLYTLYMDPQNGRISFIPNVVIELPNNILGDVEKQSARIIKTFKDRKKSTGVLLSGYKGTGKTLLTKVISMKLLEEGYPTVIVNSEIPPAIISSFLDDIKCPVVVLFDEIEKNFDVKAQDKLLGMLDGINSSKKLFLFTCNNEGGLNNYMLNRPGRIFYHIRFENFDPAIIVGYCNEQGLTEEQIQQVLTVSTMLGDFSFDILTSIVEEMKRYGESPIDVMRWLNLSPSGAGVTYDVTFEPKPIEVEEGKEPRFYKNYTNVVQVSPRDVLKGESVRAINIDLCEGTQADHNNIQENYVEIPGQYIIARKEYIEIPSEYGMIKLNIHKRKTYAWSDFF